MGELYAPLTGEVVEINDAVVDDPSQVNADAFGAWLVKIQVDPADVAALGALHISRCGAPCARNWMKIENTGFYLSIPDAGTHV